jgi:hypothetical protein
MDVGRSHYLSCCEGPELNVCCSLPFLHARQAVVQILRVECKVFAGSQDTFADGKVTYHE